VECQSLDEVREPALSSSFADEDAHDDQPRRRRLEPCQREVSRECNTDERPMPTKAVNHGLTGAPTHSAMQKSAMPSIRAAPVESRANRKTAPAATIPAGTESHAGSTLRKTAVGLVVWSDILGTERRHTVKEYQTIGPVRCIWGHPRRKAVVRFAVSVAADGVREVLVGVFAEVCLDDTVVVLYLVRRPFGNQTTVVQHHDPLADGHQRAHHVVDEEDSLALRFNIADEVDDIFGLFRVEAAGDLVENEFRVGGQHPSDFETLG